MGVVHSWNSFVDMVKVGGRPGRRSRDGRLAMDRMSAMKLKNPMMSYVPARVSQVWAGGVGGPCVG